MSIRANMTSTARMASMSSARASVREFDDDHLMQEIKYADVFKSETPSNFERWQMVGLTAVPLKQDEDQQQQQTQQGKQKSEQNGGGSQADIADNQPKGDAAEAMMIYVGGSRSHPVGIVDDRRVRPYSMKAGETSLYAADGSEQMAFFNEKGAYLVSLDNKSHGKEEKQTRMASLRHVEKDMQTHKIQKAQEGQGGQQGQQQQEQYKHEGKTINTEVRCTKDRIEFRAGDQVFGYYEVSSSKWNFNGKTAEHNFSQDFTRTANNIYDRPQARYELEDGANSQVEGQNLDLSTRVFIRKAAEDVPGGLRSLEQRIVDLEARLARLEK